MSQDNRNNIQNAVGFDQQLGARAPDWLQKIGKKFNMGVVIFSPSNQIIFQNADFINQLNLPNSLIEESSQFDEWLTFMAGRGDLFGDDAENTSAEILKRFHRSDGESYGLENISPPNGKTIRIKCVKSKGGFVTLISEDRTVEKRNQDALDLALELGRSGYFHYSFDKDETTITGQHLTNILTPGENIMVRENGFWTLAHEDDIEAAKTAWRSTVLRGNDLRHTLRISTEKNGIIWMRFSIRPIRLSSGRLGSVIGYFEDVTEEQNNRLALSEANSKTEEALKSKTHFLARISHEVRTPMNAVIGIADALIHHNKSPEITPKLELIQSSAGNILNILDDTLNHSKLDSDQFTLDPKPGDPVKTIRNVCELWQTKAAQNSARIRCHIEESVPNEIIFDGYRFEQCLNNLLSNAIKFSPGGKIDVIGTRIDRNSKPYLVVAVKDTGIGMTEDQMSRIFEPFQQGDKSISRKFGGTGLGMNITKNLIERMGGAISVKSEIGNGSIFVLHLPLKLEQDKMPSVSERLFTRLMPEGDDPDRPYERLKILVADDNPTNHMVVKSLLSGVVAEVYTADDGKEVLDILEVQDIDIILMDIHMPVMDGIESTLAIRSSKKSYSDVLIVALTADPQYQQQRLCLNIGMDFALAKPVKLIDLTKAFDHVLNLNPQQVLRQSA